MQTFVAVWCSSHFEQLRSRFCWRTVNEQDALSNLDDALTGLGWLCWFIVVLLAEGLLVVFRERLVIDRGRSPS